MKIDRKEAIPVSIKTNSQLQSIIPFFLLHSRKLAKAKVSYLPNFNQCYRLYQTYVLLPLRYSKNPPRMVSPKSTFPISHYCHSITGKVTVYLGKRDFIDHLDNVDPIDGVVVVDNDYLKGRKIYGQVSCLKIIQQLITFFYSSRPHTDMVVSRMRSWESNSARRWFWPKT